MERREIAAGSSEAAEMARVGQPHLRSLFLAFFITEITEITIHDHTELLPSFPTKQQLQPIHLLHHRGRGAQRNFCFSYSIQEGMNHSHTSVAVTPQKEQFFCCLLHLDGCTTPSFHLSGKEISYLKVCAQAGTHQQLPGWGI